jgi:hypothetical protein
MFMSLICLSLGNGPSEVDKATVPTEGARPSILKWSGIHDFILYILFLHHLLTTIFSYLPSWLTSRPHRPYDHIYATLPPIATYSTFLSKPPPSSPPLKISFHAWRPSPQWKRRAPGPPDFYISVLDSREPFPSLQQLEGLYVSVAQEFMVGKETGKVVLAVVDCGVSNYIALDDMLGGDSP